MLDKLKTLVIQLKPQFYLVVTLPGGEIAEIHLYSGRRNAVILKAPLSVKIERKLYENSIRD